MPQIRYDLVGDVSPLQDALEKAQAALKDTETQGTKTDAATKKLGTTAASTASSMTGLATASNKAATATDKAGDKANAAAKDVDKLGTATESAKKAAAGFGGPIGDIAGRIENFAGAAKGAAVALGPVGLAMAGLAVGAAAAVGVVGTFVSTVLSLQESAEAAVEELKDLKGALAIPKEDVASIKAAGTALDAVEIVAKKLNVAFSGDLAPTVERIAILVAAMGLATIDAANYFGGFGKILQDVINFALNPVNTIMGATVKGLLALAEYMGATVPASAYAFLDSIVDQNQPLTRLGENLKATEYGLADYIKQIKDALPEVEKFKTGTGGVTKAVEETTEAIKGQTAATGVLTSTALSSISERLAAEVALAEEKRRLDEEEAARKADLLAQQRAAADAAIQTQMDTIVSFIAEMNSAFSAFQDARVAAFENEISQRQAMVDEMLTQLSEGEGQLSENQEKEIRRRVQAERAAIADLEKRRKRAAIAEFLATKTVRLAQIGVETARNLVSFAAPPPIGLGPVAGPIAAAALGGISAAAVLAEPAPSFRTGGVVPENAPRAGQSDQRVVIAEPGEVIVNPEQQRKMGGATPIVALLQIGESEFVRLRSVVLQGPEAERAIRRASGMLGMAPVYGG